MSIWFNTSTSRDYSRYVRLFISSQWKRDEPCFRTLLYFEFLQQPTNPGSPTQGQKSAVNRGRGSPRTICGSWTGLSSYPCQSKLPVQVPYTRSYGKKYLYKFLIKWIHMIIWQLPILCYRYFISTVSTGSKIVLAYQNCFCPLCSLLKALPTSQRCDKARAHSYLKYTR